MGLNVLGCAVLPQAATAFPRDRDSIEPGAETGPAVASADVYQRDYEALMAWAIRPVRYQMRPIWLETNDGNVWWESRES